MVRNGYIWIDNCCTCACFSCHVYGVIINHEWGWLPDTISRAITNNVLLVKIEGPLWYTIGTIIYPLFFSGVVSTSLLINQPMEMRIYKYVCICMYMYVYVCICMYMYVYVCICMYMYVYVCICMYMYVYVCICMYMYVYVCICMYMYVYVCICMYMYVYVCICMYIYK